MTLALASTLLAPQAPEATRRSIDGSEWTRFSEEFSALLDRLDMPWPIGVGGDVPIPVCVERSAELVEAAAAPHERRFARAVHGFWLLESGEEETAVPMLEEAARAADHPVRVPEWCAFQSLAAHYDLIGSPARAATPLDAVLAESPDAHRSVLQALCLFTFRAGRIEEARDRLENLPPEGWNCLDIEDPQDAALDLEQALLDGELAAWLESWVETHLSPGLSQAEPRRPWSVWLAHRDLLRRVLGSRATDERILSIVSTRARGHESRSWQTLELALRSWTEVRADPAAHFAPVAARIFTSARQDSSASRAPVAAAALCGALEALPARTLKQLATHQEELEPEPASLLFLVLIERNLAPEGGPCLVWLARALAEEDLNLARAWAKIATALATRGAYTGSVDRQAIEATWAAGIDAPFPEIDAESVSVMPTTLLLLDGL